MVFLLNESVDFIKNMDWKDRLVKCYINDVK